MNSRVFSTFLAMSSFGRARRSPTRKLPAVLAACPLLVLSSPAFAEDLAADPPAASATPAPSASVAASSKETTSPTAAPALPSSPVVANKQYPALGGHLGFALPIATFGSKTTAIGADFVTVGVTPGITVHLDERWAIDFEFIAFNELKNTPSSTTFVVDPGIIHKWDGFIAGLRVATQVGAPSNIGMVPIVVLPLKLNDKLSYFFELDLPLFLRDNPAIGKAEASATILFQSGFGF